MDGETAKKGLEKANKKRRGPKKDFKKKVAKNTYETIKKITGGGKTKRSRWRRKGGEKEFGKHRKRTVSSGGKGTAKRLDRIGTGGGKEVCEKWGQPWDGK